MTDYNIHTISWRIDPVIDSFLLLGTLTYLAICVHALVNPPAHNPLLAYGIGTVVGLSSLLMLFILHFVYRMAYYDHNTDTKAYNAPIFTLN